MASAYIIEMLRILRRIAEFSDQKSLTMNSVLKTYILPVFAAVALVAIIFFFALKPKEQEDLSSLSPKDKFQKEYYIGGKNWKVEAFVMSRMNNPDSYEYVTSYTNYHNDTAEISWTFRGTNAFNAVMTNTIEIKMTFDGEIIDAKNGDW